MVAQRGKDTLIAVWDANLVTPAFVIVGGIRSTSISLNNEPVDVTDQMSVNEWRELLANAGMKTASLSGSGVFKDSDSEEVVRAAFMAGDLLRYQFTVPDFGAFTGTFQITALDYSGEHVGEVTFSMTFESAGPVTWTAA